MREMYLSFGNLSVRLILPEMPVDAGEYDRFISNENKHNVCFSAEYIYGASPFVPADGGTLLSKRDRETVFSYCGGRYETFYNAAAGGYYARRIIYENSDVMRIYLSDGAAGRLQMRHILNTLGIAELAARKNAIIFHASFIEHNGKAVLFAGKCGAGKSTQAELWRVNRGTEIINGDKTLLYLRDGKIFASGLPFSGSSGISENKEFELEMIVSVVKAGENRVKTANAEERLRIFAESTYTPAVFTDKTGETAAVTAALAKACVLYCTPDVRAVEALENYLTYSI